MSPSAISYDHPGGMAVATYAPPMELFADNDGSEAPGCSPLLLLWTVGAATLNLTLTLYLILWLL